MKVWLNGQFLEMSEAKVSLFDSGIQHGVGLFETMAARHGSVYRLMDHLRRLQSSAAALRLSEALRVGPLARAVEMTLDECEFDSARIRVTITGGDLMLAPGSAKGGTTRHDPTIAIVVQPPTHYPEALFESGVRVRVADTRLSAADRFAGHKTLWYWPRLAELQLAATVGCAESLYFTTANTLASGAVSNVFLVSGGKLRTPSARDEGAASPVLPGVTRARILALAAERGIAAEQTERITGDDLLAADELFLTNSSWGVLPVVAVEAHGIAGGAVGEMTKAIREAYENDVESETLAGRGAEEGTDLEA